MKLLTLEEVSNAISGKLNNIEYNNMYINDVIIDSRKVSEGNLFIAIVGDKFDAHNFIELAYQNGATCVVGSRDIVTDKPYIKVSDTKQALMDLAEYYRSLFNLKVIGITGSTGKTTTKEIIASLLSVKYKVLKTEGNFNNEIGLPLTVFRLDDSIEIAVLEMGMNHFGEIHNLSKIAKPYICVITNIGDSHIEYLGSREGILKAKAEIFDFMDEEGFVLLNDSDDLLETLKDKRKNILYFGTKKDSNFYPESIKYNGIEGSLIKFNYNDEQVTVNLKSPGKHMMLNAFAGIGVGEILKLNGREIKEGLENFETHAQRLEIIKTDDYTIINDVYNANPQSMKAAIDVLSQAEGNKICILGDMLELGDYSSVLHYEVGEYAYRKGINIIVCVGLKAYNMYEGASKEIVHDENQKQMAIYFDDQETLLKRLNDFVCKGDTILVKASRGMNFEKTIEKLL